MNNIESIILEPCSRNTAPAIALAALTENEETILLVLPSDHVIEDHKKFVDTVMDAIPIAERDHIVTFGLPQLLGYAWPFWAHALLALSLNFSAYFAEILRAGFEDIGKSQIEGAKSLGLSKSLICILIHNRTNCKLLGLWRIHLNSI